MTIYKGGFVMSIEHSLGNNVIALNDEDSIIVERKSEDGYVWDEVTFKTGEESINIGSYSVYNYDSSKDWMEYNSDFIFLMTKRTCGYDTHSPQVIKLFDIKSRQLVGGSQEELMKIYNNFKKVSNRRIKKRVLEEK